MSDIQVGDDTTIREAQEALSRLDKAAEEIGEVAANVRSRWRMSIPANPNRDTDLIVSDACMAGQRAITALLAVIEQQQAIAEWLLAEQRWRMRFPDNDSLEIVNGWLVERGAHEPNFIPNYGYEPYTDAEPIVDLSKVAGWDDPDTLRATIDRQAEALREVREVMFSLVNTLVFAARDWGTGRDLAWLWGVLCGWGDAMDEQARICGWDEQQVARLRAFHATTIRILDAGGEQ